MNSLVCKHNEFVKRLRSEMDNCSETNGAKRSMLRQTIETVESQLDMISDCREEFKVSYLIFKLSSIILSSYP